MRKSEPAANFVASARKRLNLTQPEFGDKLGVGRHAVIRYERGEPVPQPVAMAITLLLDRHRRSVLAAKKRRRGREASATA